MRPTVAVLVVIAALGGCASRAQVNAGGGGLSVQAATNRGALIAIGVLTVATHAQAAGGGNTDRSQAFAATQTVAARSAPPMDPSRRVNEQDCTSPIEDWSANLRCR